jgi:hypothetical protein
MLWALLKVAIFILAGPALACVVLLFGCEGSNAPLGVMCGHNAPMSLLALTVGAWFVLGTALAAIQMLQSK